MYFDINAHRDCFKTNKDEAYFWHGRTNGCGGQDIAMDVAAENNGKTLEMCMLDHRDELTQAGVVFYEQTDGPVRIDYGSNDQEYFKFWDDCSKAFAEQSSGNIHVIEGTDLRLNGQAECDYPSVYNRIEHPALEQNQNVNSISHIDPYTRQQTKVEVFNRHQSSAETGQAPQNTYMQNGQLPTKMSESAPAQLGTNGAFPSRDETSSVPAPSNQFNGAPSAENSSNPIITLKNGMNL